MNRHKQPPVRVTFSFISRALKGLSTAFDEMISQFFCFFLRAACWQTGTQIDRRPAGEADTGKTFASQIDKINTQTGLQNSCLLRVFLDYLCMYCKPSNSVMDRCIHYKVDFRSPSSAVWSLGCHNDSLVLLVFFEDIHIRTGSLSVFWVTWSSSWHPKERLDLTHFMLSSGVPGRVTTRAVFGLAKCSLAWHCSDWRFHQYWILMNGSYMSSAHQWLQWWWSLSRWKTPQKNSS